MQKDEAIMILSRHLMQCGMMMPIEWVQSNGEGSEFMQAFEMAMDALKNEPVRCKDCKHWRWSENNLFGEDYGTCVECLMDTRKDHFCSYGERKAL